MPTAREVLKPDRFTGLPHPARQALPLGEWRRGGPQCGNLDAGILVPDAGGPHAALLAVADGDVGMRRRPIGESAHVLQRSRQYLADRIGAIGLCGDGRKERHFVLLLVEVAQRALGDLLRLTAVFPLAGEASAQKVDVFGQPPDQIGWPRADFGIIHQSRPVPPSTAIRQRSDPLCIHSRCRTFNVSP